MQQSPPHQCLGKLLLDLVGRGPPQGRSFCLFDRYNDPCPNKKDLGCIMVVGLCREVGIGRARISELSCQVSVLQNCHGRDHYSVEMTDGGVLRGGNVESQ